MAHHRSLTKELSEVVAEQRQVDTVMLVQTLLHLADLSNPVQPYPLSRKWAQCVCAEFRSQAVKEKELGLPITPMFANLETDADVARMEIGFSDVRM